MKTRYFILTLGLALGLSACSKWLEIEPTTIINPESSYNTEEDMNISITSVYDILGQGRVYAWGLATYLGTFADEGFYASTTITTGTRFYQINPSDPDVQGFWQLLYQGIARANTTLHFIDKPDMDETKRDIIRGEALFLRAFYYFHLIRNWGDVPLVLVPTFDFKEVSYDIPRTPIREIYEKIVADMQEAEKLVPEISDYGYAGRVTKSAVRGILARVYLHWAGYPLNDRDKFNDVVLWAEKVMNDPVNAHDLNPSYAQVFVNMAQDKYDIQESIWEVEFSTTGTGNNEYGQIGSWIGVSSGSAEIGTAYGFIVAIPELFNSYEPGDLRRDRNIANFAYNGATPVFYAPYIVYGKKVAKWRRSEETALPKSNQSTPTNFPILRFSDVLLMHAEALNELSAGGNAPQQAIDDVNRVRERAWATGVKSITVTDGGTDYTLETTVVTITGGGGTGATATATVDGNGVITAIKLDPSIDTGTVMGSDYTSEPDIVIESPTGSGAAAVAEIYRKSDSQIAGTMTKEEFKAFLIAERSRELCFETLRKYDLTRWDILVDQMKIILYGIENNAPSNYKYAATSFRNAERKHYLFPIPYTEISLNQNLTQNPGY